MIVIYINNFLVFRIDKFEIDEIKRWLYINYKIKDLELYCLFLGIKVKWDIKRQTISISRIAFINKA